MKINIELDCESNTAIIKKYVNGKKYYKEVSTNDLIESIINTTTKQQKFKSIIGPLFYEDTLNRLIQTIQIDKNSYIYIINRKKSKNLLSIYTTNFGFCGTPNMIFAIKVVNNVFSSMYVTVTKTDIINEDTELYFYPFSNVNNYSYNVCTGSNRFETRIENAKDAFKYIEYFFAMPNTIESFRSTCNKKALEFRDLAKFLKDKDFPDELLVESGKKYSDFLNQIANLNL